MKYWAMTLALLALSSTTLAQEEAAADPSVEKKESSAEQKSPIPRLAEIEIDEYVVPARMINLPLPGRTKTVQDLLEKLEKYADDEQVGAVLLKVGTVALSLPDIQELRQGVEQVKSEDKKVMAFVNSPSPEAYLLACAADEIAAAPCGSVIIPGIGRIFPYMKGYYQMIGVEYDVITCGKYKYPGFLNRREPDKYFMEEFGALLDSWISDYKQMIAEGRNLSGPTVDELVDIGLFKAEDALQRGLVDKLVYFDDYRERLLSRNKMKRLRDGEMDLENVNSIQDIVELINRELQKSQEARRAVGPKIAVLHARGPIIDFTIGGGFASQVISRDPFVKTVEDLQKDRSIKAVVMHIDSPGGSAYASEIIYKALKALDEEKPLVVSQGSVAASGGYYLSAPGRRIFAHPTTLTGSIGVLGILANARSQFNRMDYEIAEMRRGERSLLGSPHEGLDPADRSYIQEWMNATYEMFLERVAEGRRMPEDEVAKIAQGRIYSGRDALKLGLVDELGGLKDAIQAAREMANIPPSAELRIVHYPRPSSLGEFLVEGFGAVSSPLGAQVTAEQALVNYLQAITPAQPLSFQQQLNLFTGQMQPLCWLAMPEFYRPTVRQPAASVPGLQAVPGSGLPVQQMMPMRR